MWIKTLLENMDRIIHGGKHYPVVNGIADVPKEVRDDLIGHTHFEDVKDAIDPETIKAVQAANKATEAPEEDPTIKAIGEKLIDPEKDSEPSDDTSAPVEETPAPKTKAKTTKTAK